jgi:hypothetical protein
MEVAYFLRSLWGLGCSYVGFLNSGCGGGGAMALFLHDVLAVLVAAADSGVDSNNAVALGPLSDSSSSGAATTAAVWEGGWRSVIGPPPHYSTESTAHAAESGQA